MSRKSKRQSPRDWLKSLVRKNACFVLPVISLAFSSHQWGSWLFLTSLPLCALYRCILWWQDAQKISAEKKRIMLLAYFWRYGYFSLIPLLCGILSALFPHQPLDRWLGYCVLFYGVYTLLISLSMCRHFICGMQDANHQEMRPYARPIPNSRRDGVCIALFFIVLGLLSLLL